MSSKSANNVRRDGIIAVTKFTLTYRALLVAWVKQKNQSEGLTFQSQCIFEIAAEAKELRDKVGELEWTGT